MLNLAPPQPARQQAGVAIGIFQRPGTNAKRGRTGTGDDGVASEDVPQGVGIDRVRPTTFVRNSIRAVVETLFEPLLVVIVVRCSAYVRASIIPLARAGLPHRHFRRDVMLGSR